MSNHFSFTKRAIEALPIPAEGRDSYYDTHQPGLLLFVTSAGRQVFYYYAKVNGKPERVKIGRFPAVTVEQARTEAAQIAGKKMDLDNPIARRRNSRNAPSLQRVFDEYVALPTRGKSKHPRSPRTTADYKWQFEKHLSSWAERKVNQITRQEIETHHNALAESSGRYMANRVLSLVKALLNFALERHYIQFNPAARLKAFEEESRERFLNEDEINRLFRAVEDDPAGDFVLFALYTGARRGNVLAARWEQIDLTTGIWRITVTKSGKPQDVILSPQAVELLKARRKATSSEWVFPGTAAGHMATPRVGWKRILAKAKIEGLRMHDLRRTLGSWQAKAGASLTVVGKSLGHSSLQATKVYARLDDAAVRQSVTAATAAIAKAGAKKKTPKKAKEGAANGEA
jgi:integrase